MNLTRAITSYPAANKTSLQKNHLINQDRLLNNLLQLLYEK